MRRRKSQGQAGIALSAVAPKRVNSGERSAKPPEFSATRLQQNHGVVWSRRHAQHGGHQRGPVHPAEVVRRRRRLPPCANRGAAKRCLEPAQRTCGLLSAQRLRALCAPRARSSATNRLIEAKDKASVQINIGHVNGTPPRHVWILCTAHALPPRSSPFWRRAPLRCGSKACGTLIPSRSVTPPCARSRRRVHGRVDHDGAVRLDPRYGRERWLLRPPVDQGLRAGQGQRLGDLNRAARRRPSRPRVASLVCTRRAGARGGHLAVLPRVGVRPAPRGCASAAPGSPRWTVVCES